MYKIIFYVPPTHLEDVKNALFKQGAGKIGCYSHCAWQVLGEGQFMPLEGNEAFIGKTHYIEKLPEYQVEMVCDNNIIHAVIAALKESHPYETPAYQIIKLEDL